MKALHLFGFSTKRASTAFCSEKDVIEVRLRKRRMDKISKPAFGIKVVPI